MKQFRLLLTDTNQWTAWFDLDKNFPPAALDGILNVQFSETLTVPETVQFWKTHQGQY
jgi:hypothetical protein